MLAVVVSPYSLPLTYIMNRHALLIAINEYPHLAASHQLKGCVNDSALVQTLLTTRFGFQKEEIVTLVNGAATREGILQGLDRLAGTRQFAGQSALQAGDLVVIAYSGHGSRIKDLEGDEADGYDSTLVPSDSDRPVPDGGGGANLDITDDVLFSYFEAIRQRIGKTGHLVLWFDCCRSGTIARDIEDNPTREIPTDERSTEPLPSLGGTTRGGGEAVRGRSGWRRLSDGYVLLAGCADDEKSKEMRHPETNDYCGAMTYHLVQEILSRSGTLTYYDVFEPTRKAVALRFPSQHPQLEGDDDRALFGTERLEVPPFVTVLERHDAHRVILAVGAVQGATVGSIYEIYPALMEETTILATVTLTEVGALESHATTNTPLPDTVEVDCRAVEREHALGNQSLIVAVEGVSAGLSELRTRIQASSLLRLAKTEPAQVLAVCHPPRTSAEMNEAKERGDPLFAPELGAIEEATWVLVGRDFGMLPSPPHPTSEADALEVTFNNLETWSRYLNVQALRPIGQDPLRPLITVQFGAVVPNVRTEVAPLPRHARTGLPLVQVATQSRLVITSRYQSPLFVAVLNLDAVGAITPIYPFNRKTREPVSPNTPIVIDLEPSLPEPFPTFLEGGRETLKIMVTLSLVDFDILGQGGTKVTDSHPALALYDEATRGGGDIESMEVQGEEITTATWTTVDVDYWIEQ
jgi:hypothetical protein